MFFPEDLKLRGCGSWSCCSHPVTLRLGLKTGAKVKDNMEKKRQAMSRGYPQLLLLPCGLWDFWS